jgi:hypothetical protein
MVSLFALSAKINLIYKMVLALNVNKINLDAYHVLLLENVTSAIIT